MNEIIKAFSFRLIEEGRNYKNLVMLSNDSFRDLKLENFRKLFENRAFNFGMGSENMVSVAQGLSIRGKMPLIAGYCAYTIVKAYEQIRNDICYPNLNVKILGAYSGLTAAKLGPGYQILEDISLMASLPNMAVVCPADY
ncbi:transketolase family protein, partial [Candidatus Peregrinibacteria bacterium]|nr:transketolase family protein [Candidatus Peregrinibacteria bacterium]